MKSKLFLLSLLALSFTVAHSEEIVNHDGGSGVLLSSPIDADYTINIKEGTTFTNNSTSTPRVINDVKAGRKYTITGGGELVVSGANKSHAVVLGKSGDSASNSADIIFDVATTINKSSSGATKLTLVSQANVFFYKNLTASDLSVYGETSGGSITFGKENSTSKYSASLGSIDASTVDITINSNYSVTVSSVKNAKSITINGGSLNATSDELEVVTTLIQNGGSVFCKSGIRLKSTAATYEYHGGNGPNQIVTWGGTVKLYDDFSTGLIKVNGATEVDLYWNGFETTLSGTGTFEGFYTDGNPEAKFNLIVDKGYNWTNDSLFVGNISRKDLEDRIGSITLNGKTYEKGQWDDIIEFSEHIITKDGTQYAGFYINTVVPEPAEWAMIFGAIALGFVAYRRK